MKKIKNTGMYKSNEALQQKFLINQGIQKNQQNENNHLADSAGKKVNKCW